MHYKDKNLQIDIRCHTVFMNDQKIELSLKEFTVLKYLTEHPGWVFSHEEIYRNVWKEEPIDCANAVMCCISQLRKKLKVDSRNWNYIRTVRGVGYKFQPLSGCLLYTSDAADEEDSVDLGGRRILKKKQKK